MLDLTRQHARVGEAIAARVAEVFATQRFILGKTVEDFERAFADAVGCPHAVGMSSGTDAQLAVLMAMQIGPGDAVVTTPYTFFSTAGCIHRVGAETIFVDIEPDNFLMDPQRLREFLVERCTRDADGAVRTPRGNRVRAVVPIHLFGVACDMDALGAVTREFGLPLIEDAAQAIGTEFISRSGARARAGNLGDAAWFSFYPTKNLGAAGDAGMAVCQSDDMAARLRLMRNHGMAVRYYHEEVGGNFRLDALQAAVLHVKLPFVAEWNAARRRNAELYRAAFASEGLSDIVRLPSEPWKSRGSADHHTYHQYVIRAPRRDDLLHHLAALGIGHDVYYPVPLHRQKCFAHLDTGHLPVSEQAAAESLALPIFPELTEDEILAVVRCIKTFGW